MSHKTSTQSRERSLTTNRLSCDRRARTRPSPAFWPAEFKETSATSENKKSAGKSSCSESAGLSERRNSRARARATVAQSILNKLTAIVMVIVVAVVLHDSAKLPPSPTNVSATPTQGRAVRFVIGRINEEMASRKVAQRMTINHATSNEPAITQTYRRREVRNMSAANKGSSELTASLAIVALHKPRGTGRRGNRCCDHIPSYRARLEQREIGELNEKPSTRRNRQAAAHAAHGRLI